MTFQYNRSTTRRPTASGLLPCSTVCTAGPRSLAEAGIGIDLIFRGPTKWRRHPHICTAAELYSEEWKAIRTSVSSLVRRAIGLDPAQCRDVVCAMARR